MACVQVVYVSPDLRPGERYDVLAVFDTVADAERYVADVCAMRDPEGVEQGHYGIDSDEDGED